MTRTISHNKGLTLYEVVLSLAILLGSMAVLGNLIATGSRAATRSRLQTQASLLCQSKLSEILAGVEPMQEVDAVAFDGTAPDWNWSLAIVPGPHIDLLELQVTATHVGRDNVVNATVTINRYVRDPQLFEEAAAQESFLDESSQTAPSSATGP